jgi:hypothetical protein
MGTRLAFFLSGLALTGLNQLGRRHAGLSGAVIGLLQTDQGHQQLIVTRRAVRLLGQEHQELLGFGTMTSNS